MNGEESDTVPYVETAIVGAGPIGLELAVALRRVGAEYLQFDAHQIGHTISWWPRDTQFYSTSERVAIAGIPIQSLHHNGSPGKNTWPTCAPSSTRQ